MYINKSTHMEEIEIEKTIKLIGTLLTLICQIQFILEVQMIDFTN
jgi:hypothetical protein